MRLARRRRGERSSTPSSLPHARRPLPVKACPGAAAVGTVTGCPAFVTLVLLRADGSLVGEMAPFPVSTPWWQEVENVVEAAAERGADVTVLRLVHTEPDLAEPSQMGGAVIYAAELHGEAPPDIRPVSEVATVDGVLDDDQLRLPWARPGGPARELAWAERVLAERHALQPHRSRVGRDHPDAREVPSPHLARATGGLAVPFGEHVLGPRELPRGSAGPRPRETQRLVVEHRIDRGDCVDRTDMGRHVTVQLRGVRDRAAHLRRFAESGSVCMSRSTLTSAPLARGRVTTVSTSCHHGVDTGNGAISPTSEPSARRRRASRRGAPGDGTDRPLRDTLCGQGLRRVEGSTVWTTAPPVSPTSEPHARAPQANRPSSPRTSVKTLRRRRGAQGRLVRRARRQRARPARTERRRQDHGRAHPHHTDPPRSRSRARARSRRDAPRAHGPRVDRPRRSVRGRRREPHRGENLRLVGRLTQVPRAELTDRIDELLEQFDLVDASDRLLRHFSGGMRRRLDLAAALVHEPPVLFLDEPTTGLDPTGRTELWQVIEGLVGAGTTVLLTTQYLEEADRLADRIVVIDHGSVIAEGTSASSRPAWARP